MAYMDQKRKKEIAQKLKAVVPAGWKYSLRVRNHMALVMTIRSAPVDLLKDVQWDERSKDRSYTEFYPNGNHQRHFSEENVKTLKAIWDVLNDGNWDKSDIMTDYFNVGWYVDLNIGEWNKPFVVK